MNIHIERAARRKILDKLSIVLDKKGTTKYEYLSNCPYLRYSDVVANKTAGWDWNALSCNPGIYLSDILSHPDDPWELGFNLLNECVSCNPGIQFQDVLQHMDKPWDWHELSANKTVTMDIVIRHLDRPWCWYKLSKNIGIRWSDIQAHPDLPWDFRALSHRPISSEQIIILNNNFGKWKWYYLSEMASFDLIQNNPDWPWDWNGICKNPNVPLAFIPDKCRNYYKLSCNHKISIQDVLAHPDANWSWSGLSATIKFQDIINHPELPWESWAMSHNPGLRLDYVMTHMDKPWNLSYIAKNSFNDDFTDYYTQLARQHLAALKIQLYWRKYATDHRYLICHRVQLGRMHEI